MSPEHAAQIATESNVPVILAVILAFALVVWALSVIGDD